MSDVPKTYQEAISSPHSHEWQKAMEEEMRVLRENYKFELTSVSENRSAVGVDGFMPLKLAQMGKRNTKHVS